MPVHNLFSKRNRQMPEKLVYEDIPLAARLACHRVLLGALQACWRDVDAIVVPEHPVPSFGCQPDVGTGDDPWWGRTPMFFERCLVKGNFLEAMDAIEAGAAVINRNVRALWILTAPHSRSRQVAPDDALEELNHRLAEYGVGYQFSKEHGQLVRVDSEFMHKQVTEPALALLTEKGFEGAAQEFDKAHQHYRQMAVDPEAGKDAVACAVKAVESTAKAILDARDWDYNAQKDTLVPLLEKLFTNGLVPTDLHCYFGGLQSALKSGLPTIGNRRARHGQGAKPTPIEEHMVTLAMHLAAATVRFLVEAHKAKE